MYNNARLFPFMVFSAAMIAVAGCGEPSEDTRQNRRLTDSLLTAVTVKNLKELNHCKQLLDKRRAESLLAEGSYKKLIEIAEMAKSGNWQGAEDALYKFREADPFPK